MYLSSLLQLLVGLLLLVVAVLKACASRKSSTGFGRFCWRSSLVLWSLLVLTVCQPAENYEQCCRRGIDIARSTADCESLRSSLEATSCGPYAFGCCLSERTQQLCDSGKRTALAGSTSCAAATGDGIDHDEVREQCCDCCMDGIVNAAPGTDCSLLLRTINRSQRTHQNPISSCNQIYVECCKHAKSVQEARPKCPQGFVFSEKNGQCKDEDECSLMIHNCTDGYRCENTFGSFKCVRERHCGTGYTVQHETQSCVDIDECENGLHNCGRGLVCHNVPGTFKCVQPQCPPDQRFDLRSGSCARIRCPAGFELRLNSLGGIARCHDVDECKQSPCGRDQTCLNTLGSFRCEGPATGQCGEGYVFRDGKCRDLDECADQSICPADARCLNLEGSFECQCIEPGFEFVAGKCVDVDECELGRPCPAGAQCRNLKGSFECSCARGFAWNSTSRDCEDVDECSSAACDHQCVNLRGSYFCLCRPGFELMADGKSCRKIKNRCPVGYEPERGSCRDIDECNDGRPRCQRPNELCVNLRGGFRCEKIVCPPGGYSLIEPNHCHSDNPHMPNMPNSHFYSFVAIPSKLGPLPATIFIVRFNPKSTMPSFNLRMNNPGKAAAAAFNLIIKSDRPRQAELVLSRTIEGPQKIQMDISTEFNDEFDEILGDCRPTWTRVHSIVHLTVYVSEHEF